MKTAENNVLEVEVLLTDKMIQENPEITEVYDSEKKVLKFEVSNSSPKELADKLSEIMPSFKGQDIIQFNPIINAVNELQQIKILVPDADDFAASERILIDNNKLIGSFNSSLAKAKKIIKEPHLEFNKKVEDIFKIFSTEAENTKNALEKNFKPIIDERERIKKEKEDNKKQAELDAIAKMSEENSQMTEQLNNQKIQTAKSEIEANLSKMIVNVVNKIPNLNIEGLHTTLSGVKGLHESMYINFDNQAIISQEDFLAYREQFNENKATCIAQINSAINNLGIQQELEKRKIAEQVTSQVSTEIANQIPVAENQPQATEGTTASVVLKKTVSDLKTDVEKFQFLTDFNNNAYEQYKRQVEELKLIQFEHPDLKKMMEMLLEKQYPVMIENLSKYAAYTEKKNELIKNTLK